ncbi:hypothetical protein DRO02_00780 [archaeon]|nr:MAG: hypothetical protein DRO02_00780 [archaeon]RLG66214.1 MAG: hypothetical protein DRO21_00195 [archaeon]
MTMKKRKRWALLHIPSKDEISLVARKLSLSIDYKRLIEQYKALIETLTENSLDVVNIPTTSRVIPRKGAFIGDVFKKIGNFYIIGNPPSRDYPVSLIKTFCRDFGIKPLLDISKTPGATLNCGDLIPINSSSVAIGLSKETNNLGIDRIVHKLNIAVFIPCKVSYAHLDNFLCATEECMIANINFKGTSLEAWLRAIDFKIIFLPDDERCSANILSLHENIIISFKENFIANRILSKLGFKLYTLSGSEILKMGGGLQCLVSLI